MKSSNRSISIAAGAAIVSVLLAGAGDSRAQESKSAAVVKQLLSEDLADIAGKEAVLLTVEYLPGGASLPHRHDAHVFVYVLEGSIVMQVDGQEAKTLRVGETFHERPGDIHRQSSNASATRPAKFLVFIVKDKGKPITRPAGG